MLEKFKPRAIAFATFKCECRVIDKVNAAKRVRGLGHAYNAPAIDTKRTIRKDAFQSFPSCKYN